MSNGQTGYRDFIIKAVILMIVIAAGIFAGIFVSVKSGLTGQRAKDMTEVKSLPNATALEIGIHFPYLEVTDSTGLKVSLAELFKEKKTILAFVSSASEPCREFVQMIENLECFRKGRCRVILLYNGEKYFSSKERIVRFGLEQSLLREMRINTFPTIVGVDQEGVIKFVSAGFLRQLNDDFIDKYL